MMNGTSSNGLLGIGPTLEFQHKADFSPDKTTQKHSSKASESASPLLADGLQGAAPIAEEDRNGQRTEGAESAHQSTSADANGVEGGGRDSNGNASTMDGGGAAVRANGVVANGIREWEAIIESSGRTAEESGAESDQLLESSDGYTATESGMNGHMHSEPFPSVEEGGAQGGSEENSAFDLDADVDGSSCIGESKDGLHGNSEAEGGATSANVVSADDLRSHHISNDNEATVTDSIPADSSASVCDPEPATWASNGRSPSGTVERRAEDATWDSSETPSPRGLPSGMLLEHPSGSISEEVVDENWSGSGGEGSEEGGDCDSASDFERASASLGVEESVGSTTKGLPPLLLCNRAVPSGRGDSFEKSRPGPESLGVDKWKAASSAEATVPQDPPPGCSGPSSGSPEVPGPVQDNGGGDMGVVAEGRSMIAPSGALEEVAAAPVARQADSAMAAAEEGTPAVGAPASAAAQEPLSAGARAYSVETPAGSEVATAGSHQSRQVAGGSPVETVRRMRAEAAMLAFQLAEVHAADARELRNSAATIRRHLAELQAELRAYQAGQERLEATGTGQWGILAGESFILAAFIGLGFVAHDAAAAAARRIFGHPRPKPLGQSLLGAVLSKGGVLGLAVSLFVVVRSQSDTWARLAAAVKNHEILRATQRNTWRALANRVSAISTLATAEPKAAELEPPLGASQRHLLSMDYDAPRLLLTDREEGPPSSTAR